MLSLFLSNRKDKKKTYHNLKNSEGCNVPKNGTLIHHLAQFSTIHIHGIKTSNCNTNTSTDAMIMFFCFLKNQIGNK